jgi:hypothetical protein
MMLPTLAVSWSSSAEQSCISWQRSCATPLAYGARFGSRATARRGRQLPDVLIEVLSDEDAVRPSAERMTYG